MLIMWVFSWLAIDFVGMMIKVSKNSINKTIVLASSFKQGWN